MYVSYNNNVHRVLCIKIGYLYAKNQSHKKYSNAC